MKIPTLPIVLTVAGVLALAGCGSSDSAPAETPAASPVESIVDTAADEQAADDPNGITKGATEEYMNSDQTDHYKLRVLKSETSTSIKDGGSNPDYDGGNDRYTTAKPKQGKQFLVVEYEVENVGNKPSMPSLTPMAGIGNGSFAQTGADDDISGNLSRENDEAFGQFINPGDKVKVIAVISVPADAKPEYFILSDPAFDGTAQVPFKL
ncbi:DUF4352 domain-containing protein [Brevibacterium sp. 91QC2O2]|uniref:DUF4352 domain-containing protein n=1 Tax=Brevibacterium TaxID=1696 RepID=UPI00211C9CD3|nr:MULTISPECIES: DUF4352 domain-containing protein [unclassified Brevibacterium]MCQ9367354.1 DUF4352 domain-containing protein [Brevibacterium sp. 91QC2O2]MCQ9384633.1 DUF4352 domain-containing protein [Brevibacterium sp. 68QC2CO]